MNLKEAERLLENEYNRIVPDEDKMIELLKIIAEETNDGGAYSEIGGIYYGQKKYDLALKYYELGLEYGDRSVHSGLGYIWYYGRTGQKDYEKAYYHFEEASKLFVYDEDGNVDAENSFAAIEATSKVADMYKNGYYVEKDYDEYKRLIMKLYQITKDYNYPEIFTRMASILEEDGDLENATELRRISVECLALRIRYNQFFGEYNRMNWCINDIYRTNEFDEENMQLWDLYYVLKKPCKVSFFFEEEHTVISSIEDDQTVINFDGKWFRSIDEFMQKAKIDNILISTIADSLYDWTIEYDD